MSCGGGVFFTLRQCILQGKTAYAIMPVGKKRYNGFHESGCTAKALRVATSEGFLLEIIMILSKSKDFLKSPVQDDILESREYYFE
jgi:hypothetical protein